MFGGKENKPDATADETGVEDEQISNSLESIPVAWFCGTRLLALSWIGPVYNQRAVEAPEALPGKK